MNKNSILKRIKYSLRFLPDKLYLQLYYFLQFKKLINFKNPKTFNEKLNWLKLHDRNPEYTKMVDKYEAKEYIASIIGEEYIIPTLGVWDKFDDIDFDKLPNQFVLKCTHDSAGLVIVKDKSQLDIKEAKKKIEEAMKYNFYYIGREWPYKNIKPRIIAEQFIDDGSGELIDYKFFCFNGVPKIVLVCSERFSSNNMCETWLDDSWNLLPIIENNHRVDYNIKCPNQFDLMKKIALKLSKDIPFVRTDFYEVNGKLFFGEMTFYPASGFEKFEPKEWNFKIGEYLKINNR